MLNVKGKTVKLQMENTVEHLYDLGLFKQDTKVLTMKKTDKLDYIKIKIFGGRLGF